MKLIDDYLTPYAESLARFSAEASAALWDLPGVIVTDDATGVLTSREDMVAGLERSYPLYRALGLASVSHEILDHRWLSEQVVDVHARWHFYDSAGQELTDSTAHDVLRRREAGLAATVCTQNDDEEKIAELARRRGIDLADFS